MGRRESHAFTVTGGFLGALVGAVVCGAVSALLAAAAHSDKHGPATPHGDVGGLVAFGAGLIFGGLVGLILGGLVGTRIGKAIDGRSAGRSRSNASLGLDDEKPGSGAS